jgi:UDP-glucose 4-epimerase/GDP-4-dehydro-6-deoxy-D-mannose reductase
MRILGTGLSGTIGKFMAKDVTPIKLDLSENKSAFSNIDFELNDTLIHLGGLVGNSLVEKNLTYSQNVNIRGTQFLSEEFKKKSVGKFVYLSTSHVYAPSNMKISENYEVNPISLYGLQKLEAEKILQETFSSMPDRLLIIRLFSVLDWGGKSHTLSGGISELIKKNTSFQLFNVDDTRDFLTPNSAAKVVLMLAKNMNINGIVNLCSGESTRVLDAVVRMLSESGFEVPWSNLKNGNSKVPSIVGDPTRIENLIHKKLNWSPGKYEIK